MHGGASAVLRRVRAALPVGADGRVGAAPSLFAALQAAREAPRGGPLVIEADGVAEFLAPLPAERLPLSPHLVAALHDLGLRTMGQIAALPPAAALDRLGFPGLSAWRLARGEPGRAPRPRRPPAPLRASFGFPEPVGSLPALEAAARLLLGELAGPPAAAASPCGHSRCAPGWPTAGRGFATSPCARRPPTPGASPWPPSPTWARSPRPVAELWIGATRRARPRGTSSRPSPPPATSGGRGPREAIHQVRAAQGPEAMLRAVEIEPWSRLPERRWALTPYEP